MLTSARLIGWVADEGETPGWDIEVIDEAGDTLALEVKGASGSAFPNFELTPGELAACQQLGTRYWLLLVADCLGESPRLQVIKNPYALIKHGGPELVPCGYRVSVPRQEAGHIGSYARTA